MINFKKMDDKDFVFINKTLSLIDEKEFSDFLKKRKQRSLRTKNKKKTKVLQKQ